MKKLRILVFASVLCIFSCGSVCAAEPGFCKKVEEEGTAETETTAAEGSEILRENDTSVIIAMDDAFAVKLGVSDMHMQNPYNDFKNLKLPAQITRQGDYYFIVDTYNDQVLYASDLWKSIGESVSYTHLRAHET